MKFVEVGGARLSAIGLGTWQFGSTEWGYGREFASGDAGAILRRALELGVNLIDMAEDRRGEADGSLPLGIRRITSRQWTC